jgi:hypothetical protein
MPPAATTPGWRRQAEALAFADAIPAKPEHIMIQTWDPNPVRTAPETDPDTMAGFLKWFLDRTGADGVHAQGSNPMISILRPAPSGWSS